MPPGKKLLALFERLSPARREALLEYAEFLASREPAAPPQLEVVPLPRPENESVIAAIKRLSKTYPMLDGQSLLNQTSALMGEHVLQGKSSADVIDRLEVLFETRYRDYLSSLEPPAE